MPRFRPTAAPRDPVLVANLPKWDQFNWPFAFINILPALKWTGNEAGWTRNSITNLPETIPAGQSAQMILQVINAPELRAWLHSGPWILDWEGGSMNVALPASRTTLISTAANRVKFNFTGTVYNDMTWTLTNLTAPITRMRLYREQDEALLDAGKIWNPVVVDLVKSCRVIRPLDYTCVVRHCQLNPTSQPSMTGSQTHVYTFHSWSVISDWSQRTSPDRAIGWSTTRGGAYEFLVPLCNEAMVDLWINLPIACTVDYATNLATYLRENLDSRLRIYFELGNELWNAAVFTGQSAWAFNANTAPNRSLGRGYRNLIAPIYTAIQAVFAGQPGRTEYIYGAQLPDEATTADQALRVGAHWSAIGITSYISSPASAASMNNSYNTLFAPGVTFEQQMELITANFTAMVETFSNSIRVEAGQQRNNVDAWNAANPNDKQKLFCYEGGPHRFTGHHPNTGTDQEQNNRALVLELHHQWQESAYAIPVVEKWWNLHADYYDSGPSIFPVYGSRWQNDAAATPGERETQFGWFCWNTSPVPSDWGASQVRFWELVNSTTPWWTQAGDTDRDLRIGGVYVPAPIVEAVGA